MHDRSEIDESSVNNVYAEPIKGSNNIEMNDATVVLDFSPPPGPDMQTERDVMVMADMQTEHDVIIRTDMFTDPCEGVTCGGHGTCMMVNRQAQCDCEDRYIALDLTCIPEDIDTDGHDFTVDCDDQLADIYPGARERCNYQDTDCDGEVDEGACSIWVLPPDATRWEKYPLNAGGDSNLPQETIKAAWDIESSGIAFVLTETAYHVFDIESLTWQAPQSRDEIFTGLTGPITSNAYAYSIPAEHIDQFAETVTISVLNNVGSKQIWRISYLLSRQQYLRESGAPYGDTHSWNDRLAPEATQVRAAWMDVSHTRRWFDINPLRLCGLGGRSSDVYLSYLTHDSLYTMESGYCFMFISPIPLLNSPLDIPGAPDFSEVGAGFWHNNTLYLFRGD